MRIDMCADMRVDLCMDMREDICVGMCRHVYRHVCTHEVNGVAEKWEGPLTNIETRASTHRCVTVCVRVHVWAADIRGSVLPSRRGWISIHTYIGHNYIGHN